MVIANKIDKLFQQTLDLVRDQSEDIPVYLDILSKYAEKAFSLILAGTEDQATWADTVYKYLQGKQENVQRGIVRALKRYWVNHPQTAIENIFALLQKDEHILRLLQTEMAPSWLDQEPEHIKQRMFGLENIFVALYKLNTQPDSNWVDLLQSLSDVFKNVSDQFAHADEAHAIYACMVELAKDPARPVAFPSLSRKPMPYFRELARILKEYFALRPPIWEGLERLEALRQEETLNKIDLSILTRLAEQRKKVALEKQRSWEKRGQKYQAVILSLAPSISLVPEDKTLSESVKDSETQFPVQIWNAGDECIWDVKLTFNSAPNICTVPEAQSLGLLHAGEIMVRNFEFKVKKSGEVQAILEYTCAFGTEKLDDSLAYRFRVYKGNEKSKCQKRVCNPYIPDRPLRYRQEFKDFGNLSSMRDKLDQLKKIIQVDRQGQGALINLYGLRRIGKTSLLYRLEEELGRGELHGQYFLVYVDAFDLALRKECTEEEFLQFIAQRIRYAMLDRLNLPVSEIPPWPKNIADAKEAFIQVIQWVYEPLAHKSRRRKQSSQERNLTDRKRLVLMLDNADLLGEPPFDTFALKTLYDLQTLSYGRVQGFFVIIATERSVGEEVWASFPSRSSSKDPKDKGAMEEHRVTVPEKEDKIFPLVERLPLLALDKNDLDTIVARVPELCYSTLALEYLWRVTGGYPSLVQFICYYIVRDRLEDWSRKKEIKTSVTLPVVQRIVHSLISDRDLLSYFNYLKFGFTGKEWDFLTELALKENEFKFDPSTMRFQVAKEMEWHSVLPSLVSKQVIERLSSDIDSDWYKIRVGFFTLWIKSSYQSRSSIGIVVDQN